MNDSVLDKGSESLSDFTHTHPAQAPGLNETIAEVIRTRILN